MHKAWVLPSLLSGAACLHIDVVFSSSLSRMHKLVVLSMLRDEAEQAILRSDKSANSRNECLGPSLTNSNNAGYLIRPVTQEQAKVA
ncbi:hypothetical protein CC78DRAFT_533763 [Lojkania enalia]|uniref:Secreted protein n=1 Tax=Lojkania enalia TaxID=147567 RepID=A0A9P4N850_9PLEO|nr:hypothetical protein CC78DRAFT_533763 [Didymosphaeria enalia]